MKRLIDKMAMIVLLLLFVSVIIYVKLQPLREYKHFPSYKGSLNFEWNYPAFDTAKRTVIIMADNDMTELFDFLTPFYLFNETGKANVYIAAQKKYPIITENGPFVLPHFTYAEIDSLKIIPDVIVIPYMHEPESTLKTAWLQNHNSDSVMILSICDGAWTAAASGLYDGVPLTSHSTGHDKLREKFSKPLWVQNTRITQSGNMFSTGGVSNATDGSLAVIEKLFGHETMLNILKKVKYPNADIKLDHTSIALNKPSILSAIQKVFFKKNKITGVLLQSGVNEMELAAVFDIYARTMPEAIVGIMPGDKPIITKYGLTVLSEDKIIPAEIDEIHVLKHEALSNGELAPFTNAQVITYEHTNDYIVDVCLREIENQYGYSFKSFVKLTLDYN